MNETIIDLDAIPIDKRKEALLAFSEGSYGLEKCLRVLCNKGIKKVACCAGNHHLFEIAYISVAKADDVFGYLKYDLLNDETVKLEETESVQTIYIVGEDFHKSQMLSQLADNIMSGRWENRYAIATKLTQDFPLYWLKELAKYEMQRNESSEETANQKIILRNKTH